VSHHRRLAALSLLSFVAAQGASAETFDGRQAIIIDGDTIAIGSERVRLLSVDTPESFRPRRERELVAALKAKERLAQLLRAGSVVIDRQGQDRYRRTLARLEVAAKPGAKSRDVGEVLIAEGQAVPWKSGREAWEERRRHWCG
jgi:micrococcal nuclease